LFTLWGSVGWERAVAYRSVIDGGAASHTLIDTDLPFAETITVPDAELLFRGNFRRAGPDLVLTGADGRHRLIPGYFPASTPPGARGSQRRSAVRRSRRAVGRIAGTRALCPGAASLRFGLAWPISPFWATAEV